MRRAFTPALLLSMTTTFVATPQYLVVHTTDGNKPYSITNIQKVTFGGQSSNSFEIHQKGDISIDSYTFPETDDVTFEIDLTSGLEKVLTSKNDLSISYNSAKQEISVSSSQEITTVVVCNLDGMVVKMLSPMTTEATISLVNYALGIYVVKAVTATATQTQKIVKH